MIRKLSVKVCVVSSYVVFLFVIYSATIYHPIMGQTDVNNVYTGDKYNIVNLYVLPGNYFLLFDNSGYLGPRIEEESFTELNIAFLGTYDIHFKRDFLLNPTGFVEFKFTLVDNQTSQLNPMINTIIFVDSEQPVSWIFAEEKYYQSTIDGLGISSLTEAKGNDVPLRSNTFLVVVAGFALALGIIVAALTMKKYMTQRSLRKERLKDDRLYPR